MLTSEEVKSAQLFSSWIVDSQVNLDISDLKIFKESDLFFSDVQLVNFYVFYFEMMEKYLSLCSYQKSLYNFKNLFELVSNFSEDDVLEKQDNHLFFEEFNEEIYRIIQMTFEEFNKNFPDIDALRNIFSYHRYLIENMYNLGDIEEFISYMVDIPLRLYKELKKIGATQEVRALEAIGDCNWTWESTEFYVEYSSIENLDLASAGSFIFYHGGKKCLMWQKY